MIYERIKRDVFFKGGEELAAPAAPEDPGRWADVRKAPGAPPPIPIPDPAPAAPPWLPAPWLPRDREDMEREVSGRAVSPSAEAAPSRASPWTRRAEAM